MNEAELPQESFSQEQFGVKLDELIGQYFELQNESGKIQMVPKILLKILRELEENPDKRDDIREQVKKILEFISDIGKESSDLYSALSSLTNQLETSENGSENEGII